MNTKPYQAGASRNVKEIIPHLWEFIHSAGHSKPPMPHSIGLKPGEVLTLQKSSGVTRMQIREGTIWLTETPAARDILLQAGDQFEFSNHWPVIIQAVGEARASVFA